MLMNNKDLLLAFAYSFNEIDHYYIEEEILEDLTYAIYEQIICMMDLCTTNTDIWLEFLDYIINNEIINSEKELEIDCIQSIFKEIISLLNEEEQEKNKIIINTIGEYLFDD